MQECLKKGVKQVRVLSRDELKQAQMKEELNDIRVEYFLCDVRDSLRLETATEGVDIIVHAAAMKRIEKCEMDPQEAIKTNILGTMNVVNAALKNNIKNAILVSTDKSCYPVNLYGATKLTAEKVWIQSNTYRGKQHPTKFSVVRYGNVLGSRGSVLHLFKDQLEKGCLKVTDTRMTRFFITLQEAVDLVQIAIEFQQGGEIFVPHLKAASIYQMAQLVAGSVPVIVTSQRGGEKLHEVLVTEEEGRRISVLDECNIINPELTSWPYSKWTGSNDPRHATANSAEVVQYTDKELSSLISNVK